MGKSKILTLVLVILMLIMSAHAETNETINGTSAISTVVTNEDSTLTTEEIKILKELIMEGKYKEKSLSITERMKKANVPSDVINATRSSVEVSTKTSGTKNLYNVLIYNDPVLGISTQRTGFDNIIYGSNYANWAYWDFYLPKNSYVYIDASGNVNGFKDYKEYVLRVDSQYTNWASDVATCRDTGWFATQPGCNQELQRSKLFYLTKGYHTAVLEGYTNPYGDYYSVNGYMSLVAIPEYTAITINSPNGGEALNRDHTQVITWTSEGNPGGNVNIELYKSGVLDSVISSSTLNDGSYDWYIPAYQPIGTDYQIRITSTDDSIYYDWSDNNFEIY